MFAVALLTLVTHTQRGSLQVCLPQPRDVLTLENIVLGVEVSKIKHRVS
jgi:putative AlgH/UPF0301 family transcriptional regulator